MVNKMSGYMVNTLCVWKGPGYGVSAFIENAAGGAARFQKEVIELWAWPDQ